MSKGVDDSVQQGQLDVSRRQTALAEQQAKNAEQTRGVVFPGLQIAEDYYKRLSSGDPMEIQKMLGPSSNIIKSNATSVKQSIDSTMPRGGENNLAKESADINAAGQIGANANKAYTGSFASLAQLAGQGLGLSANDIANAISANSSAGTQYANVGQEQAAGKASTMGFLGSLAGAGGSIGGGFAAACWIAEALFGEFSLKTMRLRYWLNRVWAKESKIGAMVMWLYRQYGRSVAKLVQENRLVAAVLRPLFDAGYSRACREMFPEPVR